MLAHAQIWTGDPCLSTYPAGYYIVGGRRSGTMKEVEMTIYGTQLTLKIPVRTCTTAWEVKEMLSRKLDKPPDTIHFVFKRGCSYAKLGESDQMLSKVMVKGISSWERERATYQHPHAIVGAGHNGLRQALEFVKKECNDFVLFERWDRVGGDAWLKQANATSKLQTELGTYHLQFDERYPVPRGLPAYPTRDQLLQHFEDVSTEYGIMPHVRLNTYVVAMAKPPRASLQQHERSYLLTLQPRLGAAPATPEALEVQVWQGRSAAEARGEDFAAASVLMCPGNLTIPKKQDYKGEDVFGGAIGYGMFSDFDYGQVEGKVVAIIGMGAFSVENLRTCLEHGAQMTYLVARRKNMVMPRVLSWLINQSVQPLTAAEMVQAMEGPYAVASDDPWDYQCVQASRDRSKVRISQRARFPISDVFFLAVYYERAEVVLGEVKRLTAQRLNLECGRRLEASCLIKALGFVGSPAVDKLLHIEEMLGYWVNGDSRRWCYSESPGVDFSKIGSTSLSPAAVSMSEVALHYLMYPKDFSQLLGAGMLPRLKKDTSGSSPAFVISARNATAIAMGLSTSCPFLAERDFAALKRERQHACHPPEAFLPELEAEWGKYCELLRPKGDESPPLEYLYTAEQLRAMVRACDAGGA